MTNPEFLIVGQGICGSWLSWFLRKEGRSFLVIDDGNQNSPSGIAAGIINPVTGRRMVQTWMIEELLPFCWQEYSILGQALNITAISQKNMIDFFPTPQMLEAFKKRIVEGAAYLHAFPEQNQFNPFFNYEFGCGEIRPVYIAHTETILPAWRDGLKKENLLVEEYLDPASLVLENEKVRYKELTAKKIIFCDGASGFENPFFNLLPFAPNKGEALIVEIPDLPDHFTYKKGMLLAPLQEKGIFWAGSSYEWNYENAQPTERFREVTSRLLKHWLKMPFKIFDHKAALRPSTLERRPFAGFHPKHPQVGILSGMGTKGCSLAPYFAKKLADHLLYQHPLPAEADIERFHKILGRN